MGPNQSHNHTHEAVKTDRQVEAEKEIGLRRVQLQEQRQKLELDMERARSDADLQAKRVKSDEDARLQKALNDLQIEEKRTALKHEEELKRLEVEETGKKKELLEPAGQEVAVQRKQAEIWQAFGDEGNWDGTKFLGVEQSCVCQYKDLHDDSKIKEHVQDLFKNIPAGAKMELLDMVDGAVKVASSCAEVQDICKGERMEKSFNCDGCFLTAKVAYAFTYNKVTEEKAKRAGVLSWFQNCDVTQHTFIAVSYKMDIRTQEPKAGVFSAQQSKALMDSGFF